MLIGALEAGVTKMVCSIGNPQGGVLQRASFPTLTPDVTVPQIVNFIGKFDVKALGIGSFGPLDLNPDSPTYGSITKTPKKEWIQYPLMTTLKDALGVPTGIDTDVNAAALAEYAMGAGKGRGSLLYVTVGTGIGGGLVIDGKVVHGLVHPEMGHMLLAPQEGDSMPDGVCPYHRHCLEGLASGPAIEKRWGLSAKLMTEDHPAWELEATYLAQMCVNMIVTVSPEIIVLGGGVMQQMHLFPQIRERVLKLLGGYVSSPSITPEGIDSYIVPPALGVNSGVIGALLLGAQALEKELSHDREVAVVVVGSTDPDEYGKQVDETLARSENRLLRFGTQNYRDLAKFYQAADLALFAKQCSLSFFDVQAAGLPVILENTQINLDRIQTGNGFAFTAGDAEDLTRRIRQCIEMPEAEYAKMKQASRAYVVQNFDYNDIARQYTEILEREMCRQNAEK